MKEFRDRLKQLNDNIDLPEKDKSKILLEINADMEAMYEELVADGVSNDEAKDIVLNEFTFTDKDVYNLAKSNGSFWNELVDRITYNSFSKYEVVVLMLTLILIGYCSFKMIMQPEFMANLNSLAVFPAMILLIAAIGFIIKAGKLYFNKEDKAIKKMVLSNFITGVGLLYVYGSAANFVFIGKHYSKISSLLKIKFELDPKITMDISDMTRDFLQVCLEFASLNMIIIFSSAIIMLFWWTLASRMRKVRTIQLKQLLGE